MSTHGSKWPPISGFLTADSTDCACVQCGRMQPWPLASRSANPPWLREAIEHLHRSLPLVQEEEAESETEATSEPEGELRVEAEQKTSVEGALASPTAAAKFEEPPSESEVRVHQAPEVYDRHITISMNVAENGIRPCDAQSFHHSMMLIGE